MTKKTIEELNSGEAILRSTSVLAFDQPDQTETFKSKTSALVSGLTVVNVFSIDDLPPLLNGFRTLDQASRYILCAEIVLSDPLLIPAGWNGIFDSTHVPINNITYVGTGALFNTLNIDGTILSILDSGTNPGLKSEITVSAPHGLFDGQFVNITATTSYNQQQLQISNVTASTFDVDIVFTADEAGLFDTGYQAIQFLKFPTFNIGNASLFDLTSDKDPISSFTVDLLVAQGFLTFGIIRDNPFMVADRGQLVSLVGGLILENCDTVSLRNIVFINVNPTDTSSNLLTLTGNGTKEIFITGCKFDTANAGQHPMKIDNSITAADLISIQDSPDNNVSDDFFDPAGLDQTNPQVFTRNNAIRKDSMSLAESRTLVTISFLSIIGTFVALQDTTPAANDFIEDPATERFTIDDETGIITYISPEPITSTILFEFLLSKVGGGTDTATVSLFQNATQIVKTDQLASITTTIQKVSYNGGIIDIEPGDTFQLFINSDSASTLNVSALKVLITRQ